MAFKGNGGSRSQALDFADEAITKARGRKDAQKQEATIDLSVVKKAMSNLESLHLRLKSAKDDFSDAIKKTAEKSGLNTSALRKFVLARVGDSFQDKKRECEQQLDLFETIGEGKPKAGYNAARDDE